jgi:RNA polymerase sigma factor (sigma-70 family)
MRDKETIERLLAGDANTVAHIRKWIRLAFGRFRSRLGAYQEDVEQDVLLELVASLQSERYRGTSGLRTYVRAFVDHKCIDRLRAARRRTWLSIGDIELESTDPSPFDKLDEDEGRQLARQVIEEIPVACRQLWRMILDGESYREMSRRTGTSESTLRVRVLRCRRRALMVRARLLGASLNPDVTNDRPRRL